MTRMMNQIALALAALLALRDGAIPAQPPAAPAPHILLAPGNPGALQRLKPTSGQVSVAPATDPAAQGFVVTIQPGQESYPGLSFQPQGAAAWNLSAHGHVEARLVNCGPRPITLTLRVDNAGDWRDNPWNAESITLKPGDKGTLITIFGHAYGRKPGYPLNPAAVVNVLIFATKSSEAQSFRIESVAAAGPAGEKPPVDSRSIRTKPAGGVLFGPDSSLDAAKQLEAQGATTALNRENGKSQLRIAFAAAKGGSMVRFKPTAGAWDLRDCLEIRVRARNAGAAPLTPRVRVESGGKHTDWIAAQAALAPGASCELVVPFTNPVPWQALKGGENRTSWSGEPGTGNKIANDAVEAVAFSAKGSSEGAVLEVESVRAALPPAPALPEWLGKRPPVEGDWIKTFDDDFNGSAVDLTRWSITGPNYWDKTSHWSKDNVVVGGGVARMRYEKKTGPHNDDPRQKESQYASGFLETYGKWTQRYGYFEARMKLPAVPGLWPAFWMMPDRGEKAGSQGARQNTAEGGMEFDVMEHLTRWGGLRYNVAMHWDGYGKDHKQTGTPCIYVQPDKDGFITAGLLWLPGLAVFYGNGREVGRWESPRISSVPSDMMFTLPTGGWDNAPLDDKQLPAEFVIDYVRAWQRRDLQ